MQQTTSVPFCDHDSNTESVDAFVIIHESLSIAIEILKVETELVRKIMFQCGLRNKPTQKQFAKSNRRNAPVQLNRPQIFLPEIIAQHHGKPLLFPVERPP